MAGCAKLDDAGSEVVCAEKRRGQSGLDAPGEHRVSGFGKDEKVEPCAKNQKCRGEQHPPHAVNERFDTRRCVGVGNLGPQGERTGSVRHGTTRNVLGRDSLVNGDL